jgi:hypothetical protein
VEVRIGARKPPSAPSVASGRLSWITASHPASATTATITPNAAVAGISA